MPECLLPTSATTSSSPVYLLNPSNPSPYSSLQLEANKRPKTMDVESQPNGTHPTSDQAHLNPPAATTPPPHKPKPPIRRRRCLMFSLCCFSLIVIIGIIILILALTVFKKKDPTITINGITVTGVVPQVTIPTISVQINLTLAIDAQVYNPNRASFAHEPGTVEIFYAGTDIGDVEVPAGKIPERGSEDLKTNVTLTLDSFAKANLTEQLLSDVLSGQIGIDSKTKISGKVTILGFIKIHVTATSDCHIVVGIPALDIKEQNCSSKTKL